MAKRVRAVVKIQLPAGKATPAPPVGTALGPHGIALMEFCKAYNERTAAQAGQIIPVAITVYEDRSFTFVLKTPPAPDLLRRAAGIERGSATHKSSIVGKVTADQAREIAELERKDLKAIDLAGAVKQIEGTARSMGIEVVS